MSFHGLSDAEAFLARAILSLADDASMSDSFWQTDQRIAYARECLRVPEHGRYSHSDEWNMAQYDD